MGTDSRPAPPWTDQADHAVRFEWGPAGLEATGGSVVVVVDVLRFTTAVEAGVGHGLAILPYRWKDATAEAFAREHGARLAGEDPAGPSLSPASLLRLESGDAVVLPSPNGSTCAAIAAERGATVVAACLRNASAVATWVDALPGPVTVVACGERWPDGSLRPSLEDGIGAGAVISSLHGSRSPEAEAAAAMWHHARSAGLAETLARCSSGREQITRGWAEDLSYASEADVSDVVPVLVDGSFVDASRI